MSDMREGVFEDHIWFEDFIVGQKFRFGSWQMLRAQMIEFATVYDPEPFHIDDEEAKKRGWGQITASGLQLNAIWRRLSKDAFPVAETVVSPGWENIRWKKPVYAGDVLSSLTEIIEARPLASRPGEGALKLKNQLVRDGDEVVAEITCSWFIRCKPE